MNKIIQENGGEAMKEHWDNAYASRETSQLGWYEEKPACSIRLLDRCGLEKTDAILDVGAGASLFIDYLVGEGFQNVIAADISGAALDKLKERLGEKARLARWVVDDVTNPAALLNLKDIALWHDRALLHFLLEDEQRAAYIATLKGVLKSGGYVIIGVFSLDGARKCSGLDLKNYDEKMLSDFLGGEFMLLESFSHTHQTPSGDERPYIYTLFQRK